jgi:6-phosphogluconolactonase/glucosamine-6-phosphate isomerase/deaminase
MLGLGTDAHTAGVLPGSPAVEPTDHFVVGYAWTDYQRMTSSLTALRRIAIVWLLAYGEAKAEALRRLYDNAEPLCELPGAILYELPEVYVYNDAIESEGTS